MTGITEAAQGLLYPDKYSIMQPENPVRPVVLPESTSRFVRQWPELIPFLKASAKANPSNFLHMTMVYELSLGFARDLFSLFPRISDQSRNQIYVELGFAELHDEGKASVGKDGFDESHALVNPVDIRARPSAHNGYHWAHPTFSALTLYCLAQVAPEHLERILKLWSGQSLLHHRDYMLFAESDSSRILHAMTHEAWIAHFIFSVSDVAVAMKMDRPNGQGNHMDEKITQVLTRKHLSNNNLRLFLGEGVHVSLVRPILLDSCMDRLGALRQEYSPLDCTQPLEFLADGFWVDCRTDSVEVDSLAKFSRVLWDTQERALMAPIERMDRAGVLQIR